MTMSDIVCPKCKSQNWYEWSTDEIAFDLDEINNLRKDLTVKYPLSFINGISATINEINRLPNADVVPKSEVDDLKRYIILNEDIAIKCKRENGEQNEEYWEGKISAFRQIRAYIDAELKKKYTEV